MNTTLDAPALSPGAILNTTTDDDPYITPRPLIINVRGTNGSGKSTLVREVMTRCSVTPEFISGRKQPIGYTCTRPDGRTLYVPGHYETPCGGCDTIKTPAEVYELVRRAASAGHDVLFEGIISQDDVRRCVELDRQWQVFVLFLDVDIDECLASVKARRAARGDDKPLDPANTVKRALKLGRIADRLMTAGVEIRRVDRAEALESVLRVLDLDVQPISEPAACTALARLSDASRALVLAKTIPEVRELRDQAATIAYYIRSQKLGLDQQNIAVEFRLRCERRLGSMLEATVEKGGRRVRDESAGQLRGAEPSLPDGVSSIQSHRWRRAASVKDETFELWLAETRAAGDELTTIGLLRLAKNDGDDGDDDGAGDNLDLELAPGGLAVDVTPEVALPAMTPPSAHVRPVQLFFDGTEHADFAPLVEDLKAAFHTTDIETTVAQAVRFAHRALCSPESIAC